LVTPSVDRPPRATPGRCVPAAAGAHCEPPVARESREHRTPRAAQRPLIAPSFPSLRGRLGAGYAAPDDATGRWISCPSPACPSLRVRPAHRQVATTVAARLYVSRGAGSCLRPPACPPAAAQASPLAQTCHDKPAERPVAAD
jgi:hypothetical protein